eukprot:3769895-Rhodomonas_salina.2
MGETSANCAELMAFEHRSRWASLWHPARELARCAALEGQKATSVPARACRFASEKARGGLHPASPMLFSSRFSEVRAVQSASVLVAA